MMPVSSKLWRRTALLALLVAIAPTTGCAAWFLNGAEEHVGAPQQYVARFTAPQCTLANGSTMAGAAGQWYFLAQDERGPVLYELDQNGEGAAIRNWWLDDRGTHFFVWVSGSHGWAFTFPADRSQMPTRFVFPAGSYQMSTNANGVTIPLGQPQAMCTLIPG